MANLRETATWEAGIYQWETSDPVTGGENGIDNKPTRQLANRTVWLKTELAKAVESIGSNKSAADTALNTKADKATAITAGNGLSGGGNLTASRTIALGTPSKITASTANSVTSTSHTHEIDKASTSVAGVVQLYNGLGSAATDLAATAAVVKQLNDIKATKSTTLAGYGIEDWVVSGSSLSSSDNLNSITAKGFYYQASSANASFSNNYPETRAGVLVVSYSGGGMQRYTTIDGHEYVRVLSSAVWNDWLRVDARDAVMTSGSQTISGEKTFSSRTYHNAGVTFSTDGGKNVGRVGANQFDTHISNTQSGKFLQLKNDGSLAYSNDPVLLQSALSNATNNASTTTPASVAGVKTAYDKAVAAETAATQATPSGAVAFFAGAATPAGWLKANGAAVSRTTYADLFRAIGTTYGAGNGSSTFNLPDLRGEFVRGFDDGRKVDSGRTLGSAQSDAIRNITGQLTTYRRTDRDYLVLPSGAFAMVERVNGSMGDGGRDDWAMTVNFDASKVVPTAAENRPRNIALLACIKI